MQILVNSPVTSREINALMELCWNDHNESDYQPILERNLAHVVARDNQNLIGFCNLAWDGGRHATVFDLCVHPDYRHQGIALKMLEWAPKIAQDHGIKYLHVDFDSALEELYKKAGFEIISAGIVYL